MTATVDITKKRIKVHPSSIGPYIVIATSEYGLVSNVLDRHHITHELQDGKLSINDGPFMSTVNFAKNADAQEIQEVLDNELKREDALA